jgi:hypothetical protein
VNGTVLCEINVRLDERSHLANRKSQKDLFCAHKKESMNTFGYIKDK